MFDGRGSFWAALGGALVSLPAAFLIGGIAIAILNILAPAVAVAGLILMGVGVVAGAALGYELHHHLSSEKSPTAAVTPPASAWFANEGGGAIIVAQF